MKLRKLLFLCLLSATSVRLLAQFDNVNITTGPVYDCPEAINRGVQIPGNSYIGADGSVLDLLLGPVGGYGMAVSAGTLTRGSSSNFFKKFPESHYKDNAIVQIEDKVYWLTRSVEKKVNRIIAYELDTKTGQCSSEGKVLAESDDDMEFGSARGRGGSRTDVMGNNSFGVGYCMDEKHVVLHYQLYEPVLKDKMKYKRLFFVILDSKLNKLVSREAEAPYAEHMLTKRGQYTADSKGNIYFLSESRAKTGVKYEVSCLRPDATSFQQLKLSIEPDHELFRITMAEDSKGDIYAAAYTRRRLSSKQYSNMYLYKIDLAAGKATQIVQVPVPFYDQSEHLIDSMGLKGSKRFPYMLASEFRAQQILFTPDGDRIIIGSGFEYYPGIPTANGNPTYYGMDIHFTVAYVSVAGEVKWMKLVKQQNNDPINFIAASDGLYLLYSAKHDPSRYWDAEINAGVNIPLSSISRDIILSKITYDGKQMDKILALDKEMVTLTSAKGILLAKIKGRDTSQYQWIQVKLKE